MEFGAREIMIALGLLVVLAIVLDVFRRIRASRYNSIRMPRRKQPVFDESEPVDEYGSELPKGGARIVAYRDENDIEEVGKTIKQTVEEYKPKLASLTKSEPSQGSLGFEEPPNSSSSKVDTDSKLTKVPPQQEPVSPKKSVTKKESAAKKSSNKNAGMRSSSKASVQTKPAQDEDLVNNVVVLHVMANKDEGFAGDKLKEVLLAVGLRYGSMKIFHYHEKEDGSGSVLFSVANSINPGTFDLNGMEQFSSPGVSLFFSMPDVENPVHVFDLMLAAAEKMAKELDGIVSDDTRSFLTRQTIAHYRQRLSEYTRAQLSRSH